METSGPGNIWNENAFFRSSSGSYHSDRGEMQPEASPSPPLSGRMTKRQRIAVALVVLTAVGGLSSYFLLFADQTPHAQQVTFTLSGCYVDRASTPESIRTLDFGPLNETQRLEILIDVNGTPISLVFEINDQPFLPGQIIRNVSSYRYHSGAPAPGVSINVTVYFVEFQRAGTDCTSVRSIVTVTWQTYSRDQPPPHP